ncbi:unnamed protein product [Closterium sp. Yama58-4]|nr:unnamed protein product [Closterium sp. Yama58-4]
MAATSVHPPSTRHATTILSAETAELSVSTFLSGASSTMDAISNMDETIETTETINAIGLIGPSAAATDSPPPRVITPPLHEETPRSGGKSEPKAEKRRARSGGSSAASSSPCASLRAGGKLSPRSLAEELELEALQGKLRILDTQRELSAVRCQEFVYLIERSWSSMEGCNLDESAVGTSTCAAGSKICGSELLKSELRKPESGRFADAPEENPASATASTAATATAGTAAATEEIGLSQRETRDLYRLRRKYHDKSRSDFWGFRWGSEKHSAKSGSNKSGPSIGGRTLDPTASTRKDLGTETTTGRSAIPRSKSAACCSSMHCSGSGRCAAFSGPCKSSDSGPSGSSSSSAAVGRSAFVPSLRDDLSFYDKPRSAAAYPANTNKRWSRRTSPKCGSRSAEFPLQSTCESTVLDPLCESTALESPQGGLDLRQAGSPRKGSPQGGLATAVWDEVSKRSSRDVKLEAVRNVSGYRERRMARSLRRHVSVNSSLDKFATAW